MMVVATDHLNATTESISPKAIIWHVPIQCKHTSPDTSASVAYSCHQSCG